MIAKLADYFYYRQWQSKLAIDANDEPARPDYSRQSCDRPATLPEQRQSSCALKVQVGELPIRLAAKRSNIAPSAETNLKHSRRCLPSSRVTTRSTECRQVSS